MRLTTGVLFLLVSASAAADVYGPSTVETNSQFVISWTDPIYGRPLKDFMDGSYHQPSPAVFSKSSPGLYVFGLEYCFLDADTAHTDLGLRPRRRPKRLMPDRWAPRDRVPGWVDKNLGRGTAVSNARLLVQFPTAIDEELLAELRIW